MVKVSLHMMDHSDVIIKIPRALADALDEAGLFDAEAVAPYAEGVDLKQVISYRVNN